MLKRRNKWKWYSQVELAFLNEWSAIFSDRGAVLILLIAVWIYPLVYSVAYQNNVVREIPMSVVDNDKTASSRQLIRMMGATREIGINGVTADFSAAEQHFWEGDSKGIILIPADFEKSIFRGQQTHVGLYCDAGYFMVYKESLTGAIRSTATFSAGVEIKRLMAKGIVPEEAKKSRDPITLKSYTLYNPAGSYGSYVMPGIILVILQQTLLVGIGMIGGGRRERQKLAASAKQHENSTIICTLAGRSLAYFLLYSFNIIFTQVVLSHWFGFPEKGSMTNLLILMIPFLFSVIFMGLTVSLLMTKRENSIMMLVFLSPVVLFLSGMSWPVTSIPPVLYKLAHLFPTTSMIPAALRIRTMGSSLRDVRPELLFITGQMFVYGITALLSYKRFLHREQIRS